MKNEKFELATFGGGCFWCIEAIFREINGVEKVVSGYSGGISHKEPTYKEVCSGLTGHAEVVQATFDSNIITYKELLEIFMTSHDPSLLYRQGSDWGSQYRSVIYFHNDGQNKIAELVVKEVAPYYETPVVTEISPLIDFNVAEDYHQDYYTKNQERGYCNAVISPELAKLRNMYADKVRHT